MTDGSTIKNAFKIMLKGHFYQKKEKNATYTCLKQPYGPKMMVNIEL